MNDTELLFLAVMVGTGALLAGTVWHESGHKVKWSYVALMTMTTSMFVLMSFMLLVVGTWYAYRTSDPVNTYAAGMATIMMIWALTFMFPNPFSGFEKAAVQALARVLPTHLSSKLKATN